MVAREKQNVHFGRSAATAKYLGNLGNGKWSCKMTNTEYRSHPAISRSELFKIGKSPLHFKYERENPPEPSAALIFGQAFHKFVLEPDSFGEEFAIQPETDRRTKQGKEEWAYFLEKYAGKKQISLDNFETFLNMKAALKANRHAAALIEQGQHETPFFWTDTLTGEECKCRPDILAEFNGVPIIADLKSCASADTESFAKDVVKYGYDLQAYMYSEGVKANTGKDYQFIFIAVEKTPPYAVNVMQADKYILMRGEALFREYIGTYHDCKESGNWWSYNGHFGNINILSLPAYLRKDFE